MTKWPRTSVGGAILSNAGVKKSPSTLASSGKTGREQDHFRVVPAATATRTRAHFAIPTFQHSIMAASASSSQVLTLAERQSRVAAFKAAMSDPDRRADAQAGLTEPAWIQDVLSAVVEPTREDDHLGLFLGFIPNLEWLVLREGNPNATWPELVEMWYGEFGVKFDPHRGDTPSRIIGDLNLAGWAAVMADLIRDVAVLACGTYKAPHALDITKRYDICNRVVQLKDGLGGPGNLWQLFLNALWTALTMAFE